MEKRDYLHVSKKIGAGILAIVMLIAMYGACLPTFVQAESGVTYYVAVNGADTNDGLSAAKPLSYKKASETVFNGGDSVLLKRGDVFYGTFAPQVQNASADNRLNVGAYGTGELPQIRCAKIIAGNWTLSTDGFYHYALTSSGNYIGLKDDNTNVAFMADADNNKWGVRKLSAAACTAEYDFYCDETGIYVKSDVDPYEELGTLILAVNAAGVQVASFMNVHDLHVRYVGSHGICQQAEGSQYVHIYDCVIEDVGGSQLSETSKYGNGIEFYGAASHVVVENNVIRNAYDVGFTLQGGGSCVWQDVTVRENVFAYNTQSFEIWTNSTVAGKGMSGVVFADNVCINQGEGWGTLARPDIISTHGQVKMADVLVYEYTAPVLDLSITGNTFYNRSENNRVYSVATVGTAFFDKAAIDNNHVYLPQSTSVYMSTDISEVAHGSMALPFADWQTQYGHDTNSTFTAIGFNASKYAVMESTALTCANFGDIINAVQHADIATVMEGSSVVQNGSFETGDLTGWTAEDSVVAAGSVLGWEIEGNNMAVIGSTQKNGVGAGWISQEITVTPDTVYDIGATYRQNNGTNNGVTARFTMTVTDAEGNVLFTDNKAVIRGDQNNKKVNGFFYTGSNQTLTVKITCESTAIGTRPGSFQSLVDGVCIAPRVHNEMQQNGSFETGDLTGWTGTDSSVISGSLIGWEIDGRHVAVVGGTQKYGVGSGSISQEIAVTADTIYNIGATYRQNNGNNNGVTTDFTMTVTAADGTELFSKDTTVARANGNVSADGMFHTGDYKTVTVTISCASTATGTLPGSFQNLVDAVRVVPCGEKPFENGSFETGDLTGWTGVDATAIAASAIGWGIDGDYVALLGLTKNGNKVSGSISQEITVEPGAVYTVGTTYRQNNGNNNGVTANFTMTVTGGDGTVLFTDNKAVVRANQNVVVEGEFYTAENFMVTVTIMCEATATATPGSFQNVVDNIKLAASDVQNFQNGSFETGDLTGWAATDSVAITGSTLGWEIDDSYVAVVGSTQKNGVGSGSISQEFVVVPGSVYNIGAIYRQNNGNGNGVTTNFTMTVTGGDGTVLFTDNKTVVRANGNVAVADAFNVGNNCTITVTITTTSSCTGTRPGSFQNLVDGVEVFRAPEIVGGQIRDTDNALRFVMKVEQSVLDHLTERYGADNVEIGTILVNNDKFTGSVLTVTDKTSGFGSANPTTLRNTSAFVPEGMAYKGYKVYTAVIRKLDTEAKMETGVAVRAYIKVTDAAGNAMVYYSLDEEAHGGYVTTYNEVAAIAKTAV